jgi:predicted AAA+ superfamily ATPase
MPRLLRVLAHHSGQLVNYSGLGVPLGMNHVTTQKHADIFEKLFRIRTLEPWYTNELKRLVKTPKLHFLDSGLLAAMRNLSPSRLQADRNSSPDVRAVHGRSPHRLVGLDAKCFVEFR